MMVASLGGILKTIFWIFIISGIIQFIVKLTANYAVRRVNEEVKNNQRTQSNSQNARAKQTSGNKTPDSEYVDFIEIKDQE
jgi:heme/copper-type cytochrome/quinol oxidase subunit 3